MDFMALVGGVVLILLVLGCMKTFFDTDLGMSVFCIITSVLILSSVGIFLFRCAHEVLKWYNAS